MNLESTIKVSLEDIKFEWERTKMGKVRKALTPDYLKELYDAGVRRFNRWVKKREKDLQILQQTTGQVCLVGLPPSLPKAKIKKKKSGNGNSRSKPAHD
jgi:hypothetical protein